MALNWFAHAILDEMPKDFPFRYVDVYVWVARDGWAVCSILGTNPKERAIGDAQVFHSVCKKRVCVVLLRRYKNQMASVSSKGVHIGSDAIGWLKLVPLGHFILDGREELPLRVAGRTDLVQRRAEWGSFNKILRDDSPYIAMGRRCLEYQGVVPKRQSVSRDNFALSFSPG